MKKQQFSCVIWRLEVVVARLGEMERRLKPGGYQIG